MPDHDDDLNDDGDGDLVSDDGLANGDDDPVANLARST